MKQAISRVFDIKGGTVIRKRSILFLASAVALVFAFAAPAYASVYFDPAAPTGSRETRARTWNWQHDYYSWGMFMSLPAPPGANSTTRLADVGANPTNPGVHANYLANTAKCGICHSVHRARGDGVHLLDTANATCAGCHVGAPTVTDAQVTWGAGGPHGSASTATCAARSCHMTNPHGAGGSQHAIVCLLYTSDAADE